MKAAPLRYETGSKTHVGNVRLINEDSLLVDEARGLWLVADGMGGHKDGKLASNIVVESARTIGNPASAPDLLSRFTDRVLRAHSLLTAMGDGSGPATVGSTVAALLVFGGQFACVWSGDSRVYLIRRHGISQLSRDHTEVQDLLDRGLIRAEEASTWPRRNVITRAVGAGEDPGLDVVRGSLLGSDRFVICSDGLTGHVQDDEILRLVTGRPPQPACDTLVDLALERGGKDNVSVIVLHVAQDNATTIVRKL